ncbi:MAG: phosphoribosylaminoimidazolesuccinocarboxamide synthase [Candidatus Aminicenantes bacterium]|jgi:phosphoribosylaminoimidazole-succinocarboxamide synthase|nr:phosphoribosylaminoimidazolesuccinocarboxamide synthase [Candidatus Aminicenantes bacterium]
MVKAYSEISIPELPLYKKGKVREVYEIEDKLLIVASDRISAFDYVLPSLIPDKGKILTQLSKFWFDFTSLVCPNHLLTDEIDEFPPVLLKYKEILEKRSMLVHKTEVIPVECVVRGYLSGSGWKDYKATGKICGVKVPSGLREADRLDEIIFTPATKATEGHDQNISFKEMQKLVEPELANKVKKVSLELFQKASFHALSKGIIIADTKFEFGLLKDELILIDEIFTPDSSRFWPLASYSPGQSPPSLDKQFVRNYLESTDWDKESPPPPLPQSIIEQTSKRYLEIYSLLTGKNEL